MVKLREVLGRTEKSLLKLDAREAYDRVRLAWATEKLRVVPPKNGRFRGKRWIDGLYLLAASRWFGKCLAVVNLDDKYEGRNVPLRFGQCKKGKDHFQLAPSSGWLETPERLVLR